jgi:hypothetical protein
MTDFGGRYFSKPPFRSLYFWLATIYLAVVLGMALMFGKHYYARLSPGGLWWMCLSAAAPVVLWVRAWQSHSHLYEIRSNKRGSDLEDQTRLDAALEQAAYLENTGLGMALFGLMAALISLSQILPK